MDTSTAAVEAIIRLIDNECDDCPVDGAIAMLRALAAERDALSARCAALEQEQAALRGLLRDIEWNGDEDNNLCPCCATYQHEGHTAAHCRLAAALSTPSEEPRR